MISRKSTLLAVAFFGANCSGCLAEPTIEHRTVPPQRIAIVKQAWPARVVWVILPGRRADARDTLDAASDQYYAGDNFQMMAVY